MLEKHSIVHALIRKYCGPGAVAAAALLFAGNNAWAASSDPAVRLLRSVAIPVSDGNTTNGMFSFDISFVDPATGDYFLADRSNQAVERVIAESIVTQISQPAPTRRLPALHRARSNPPVRTIVPVPTGS